MQLRRTHTETQSMTTYEPAHGRALRAAEQGTERRVPCIVLRRCRLGEDEVADG
jgi:hypothetical protein